ncbi:hypothetical protein [Micromonospora musae]|uniref:hypothetical protein n=1 Tax=Micromonospora musae TaxID=1894970 RepID=UPI0033C2AA39
MPDTFRRPRALVALAALLALAGCDGNTPGGAPTGRAEAPTTGVGSTTPSAVERSYHAADLDLCARTSLEPLADLALTVTRTDPKPPVGRPGAACLFEMRTKAGYEANLRVEASTPATVDEARQLYRGTQQATGMTALGSLTDVGDEAEAFSKRSAPGFKYAEYMVHSRSANLVVKVWLAVGGDSYAPTSSLAAKSLAVLKATRQAVPTV